MSPVHRYHPDPAKDDPPDAVLWDDCERCDEHSRDIVSLDNGNLRALIEKGRRGRYSTKAEFRAGRWLERFRIIAERLGWYEAVPAP